MTEDAHSLAQAVERETEGERTGAPGAIGDAVSTTALEALMKKTMMEVLPSVLPGLIPGPSASDPPGLSQPGMSRSYLVTRITVLVKGWADCTNKGELARGHSHDMVRVARYIAPT